jgi:dTDP-4-amino-4,6-dideoxygalactose transaminase
MIPVFDLKPEIESLWPEITAALEAVLQSGQFILGPQLQAFEEEAAAYLGVKYAVGVNSGTDALVIALQSTGIGSGDEVITTPFTFFATAEAISRVGASPVFVDIDPRTYNLDPVLVTAAVTSRTKAILPVHLYGQAADLEPLLTIAAERKLKIIEDTAQAMGGEYKGKKLGTIGDVGCFSFFPTKNLGAFGDGGLVVTNGGEIAEKVRMFRTHGSKEKYRHEFIGCNSRLDELQAAILRVKLPYLEKRNESLRQVAQDYAQQLAGLPGIILPWEAPEVKHVFHQYTIRIEQGRRDKVQQYLRSKGIGTMVYYPSPLHKLPVYLHLNYHLPRAERAAEEVLSLPIWPLIPGKAINRVGAAFRKWAAKNVGGGARRFG